MMYSEIPLTPLPKEFYFQEPMMINNQILYDHFKDLIKIFHDELYMALFFIFYILSIIQTGRFIRMKEMYNHSQKEKQSYIKRIEYLVGLTNAYKGITTTIIANNNEKFIYCTGCEKCENYSDFYSFTSMSEDFEQYYSRYTSSISADCTIVENITELV
jgi:hypothetical protein